MILVIDNYDSFVYNLVHYIEDLGAKTEVVRNDALSVRDALKMKPRAVVLSPGPCTPNEAGICLQLLAEAPNDLPILGVCLGHQAIGQAFGGDVIRAKAMFDKVSIPCLGVVENMSYFVCDGCNKRHEIFLHGGAKQAAERMLVPFLGEIPIEPAVVQGGDQGEPIVHRAPQSQSAKAFLALAENVATSLAKTAFDNPEALAPPTLSISGGSLSEGKPKKKGLPVVS